MTTLLRPAISVFLLLTLVTGIAYPLAVTGIARLAFPASANGSLIPRDGQWIGSDLIGQSFTAPGYFWGRPSATAPVPYNAAASGGSNLGPRNPALADAVRERLAILKAADASGLTPLDLVTASASGLDPHISPAAARYQVGRVALARGLRPEAVQALIIANTQGRQWGVFGAPRVNVLRLNLALDGLAAAANPRR